MTIVADVRKGQTLTKLSMRHQVCPGETCCTTIPFVCYNHAHVQGQK